MRLALSLGALTVAVGVFVYSISPRDEPPRAVGSPLQAEVAKAPRPQLLRQVPRSRMEVTIREASAQAWFDQGLFLVWAANGAAAEQSFLEAARLDPRCAMCWWGAALAIGPTPDAGITAEQGLRAWEHLRQAARRAAHVSKRERAYIDALSARHAPEAPESRRPLNAAYREHMHALAAAYPEDAEAQVLLAEALMVEHAWDYYDAAGRPREWTPGIRTLLDRALSLSAQHPGALRYALHLAERSAQPADALPLVQALADAAGGQGHLLHVPSHLLYRLGRYHDAAEADLAATRADRAFLQAWSLPTGLYASAYVPHHWHSLFASSLMQGRSTQALEAARATAEAVNLDQTRLQGYEAMQQLWASAYYALARFGRWPQVLAEPPPPADLAYPTALWHFVRGLARVREGSLQAASGELTALATLAAHPQLAAQATWGGNGYDRLAAIAEHLLAAELAAARGEARMAFAQLRAATQIEDSLRAEYPPAWPLPVRHVLGQMLLDRGQAREAQQVFEADLARNPDNGWALLGLADSLSAQGLPDSAVRQRHDAAWQNADVQIKGAGF